MLLVWLAIVLATQAHAAERPSVQVPSVQAMASRLNGGRLILKIRFRAADEDFVDEMPSYFRQVARAVNQVQGRFAVYVPAELDSKYPPDTVLSRRRASAVFRALLEAGSNPARLVDPVVPMPSGVEREGPVPAGQARAELVRIR